MTIRARVFLSLGMLLISSLCVISYGIYGSQLISISSNHIEKKTFPIMESALRLSTLVKETVVIVTDTYIEEEGLYLDDLPGKQASFHRVISSIPDGGSELKRLAHLYDSYIEKSDSYLRSYLNSEGGHFSGIDKDIEEVHAIAKELALEIATYRANRSIELSVSMQKIREEAKRFTFVLVVSGAVLLLVVVLLILTLSRLTRNIGEVVAHADKLADGDLNESITYQGTDEVAALRRSFEVMRLSLKDMIENLDNKVIQRTHELNETKKEVFDILNSVKEGIFTFNEDLKACTEHSKIAEYHFVRKHFRGAEIGDLFNLGEGEYERFRAWANMCFGNSKIVRQWDKYKRLSPVSEFKFSVDGDERILDVNFQPVLEGGKLKRIMVLSRDITAHREAENALFESHREQHMIVERVTSLVGNDFEDLREIFNASEKMFSDIKTISTIDQLAARVPEIFREVHTLKGHWGTLGFDAIAAYFGDVEHLLVQLRNDEPVEISDWQSCLENVSVELSSLIQLRNKIYVNDQSHLISIDNDRYQRLLQAISENKVSSRETLYQAVYNLNSLPIETYIKKYQKFIERSKVRLNKDIADLEVTDKNLLVHREVFSGLDDVILHVIRNAVDHGIESIETRDLLNKGPGHISINYYLRDNYHHVVIADDGAGIDPEAVGKKAVKLGLIEAGNLNALNSQQKRQLIFEAGFSTKEEVSSLSGRGVGMDVVKNRLEGMNGFVELESVLGKGTSFTLCYPVRQSKVVWESSASFH